MNLIPEQRADKNGKIVTRHVRNAPAAADAKRIPAPAMKTRQAKAHKPKTVQNLHKEIRLKRTDDRLKTIARKEHRIHDLVRFTCSDAEAYEVFSTVENVENALCLLALGIRTKNDAQDFLSKHGLDDLRTDSNQDVDEFISRGLQAIPAMKSLAQIGHQKARERPGFYDSIEAHSVRVLRDGSDIPYLILTGSVSLSDVKTVGATRIVSAEARYVPVVKELEDIGNGTSPFDAETLKRLIMITENESTIAVLDPLTMAKEYDAERVLGLKSYSKAAGLHVALKRMKYSAEQRWKIMKLSDDMVGRSRGIMTVQLCELYDAGLTADEIVNGLDNNMRTEQMIAVKEGLAPSVSSGWL